MTGPASRSTFVLPLAVVLAIAWGVFLLCRRDRIYRLHLPVARLPLIPVFDIRSFIPEDVAHDRYLYLPLFGALAFAVAAAVDGWARLRPRRRRERDADSPPWGSSSPLLLVPVTRSYNRAWMDEIALWERGVQTNPETAFPHVQLGDSYRRAGRIAEARRELERALALNPGITAAHVALAAVAQKEGRFAEAEEHLKTVLTQYPDLNNALELLGMVYRAEGKLDDAIAVYEHARRVTPYQRGLYTVNLAVLQRLAGRTALARRELESLGGDLGGTKDPEVMRAWWYLGELDREDGRKDEAIALYEKYLAATEQVDGVRRPVAAPDRRRPAPGGARGAVKPAKGPSGRSPPGRLELRQYGDHSHHRRAVVAVGILDAAVGSGRGRLVVGVEVGVEAAVVDEGAGRGEAQGEGPGLAVVVVGPLEQDVQAEAAGGVDEVVAHHGVVVGVHVDPFHGIAGVNGLGEGREAVLLGDDDLEMGALFGYGYGCVGGAPRARDYHQAEGEEDDRERNPARQSEMHHRSPFKEESRGTQPPQTLSTARNVVGSIERGAGRACSAQT